MKRIAAALLAIPLCLPLAGLTGCEGDEEVMEVETSEGETEIERDSDTGALQVDD
jgi:hypothetical protein